MGDHQRTEFFEFRDLIDQFQKEFDRVVRFHVQKLRNDTIPPENTLHFSHGARWLSTKPDQSEQEQSLQVHTHEANLPLQRVVDHDLDAFGDHIEAIVNAVHEEFIKTIYDTVSKACDESGNIVDAKEAGSSTAAFLEMLRKIEFGVDRQGNPTRPSIHMGSEAIEKFRREADALGDPFKREVEQIASLKEDRAREKETARRTKFRTTL